MTSTSTTLTKKSVDTPDEVRSFDKGTLELVNVGDMQFSRATFQPGWKWSECVKPLMQTDSCEVPHQLFVQSGALHIVMDDGAELDAVRGDVVVIAPGHDAWVVGDEPCVMYDFTSGGDDEYGKSRP